MSIEIFVQIRHLVCKLLDIIYDNECIGSAFGEYSEKILEIFFFHRIDIYEIKKTIGKYWNNCLGISPDRIDIFEFAIAEVLDCKVMHIPCIFDRGDIGSLGDHTCELECRVSIGSTDFENMFWIFFLDYFFEELCIF